MFTVLICDKHIEKDCREKYYIYLKPFLDSDEFAFCEWNSRGASLDEAVPSLKNLVKTKKEWRAVIVNDSTTWDADAVHKRNPFNFADSKREKMKFLDLAEVLDFRERQEQALIKAVSNPLMKLTTWLCGAVIKSEPRVCYGEVAEQIEKPVDGVEYFLALRKANLDAADVETDRVKARRFARLSAEFDLESQMFNPPQSVLAVSERSLDVSRIVADEAWKTFTEFDYSSFGVDNLYPGKVRYLLFDMPYIRGCRNENRYFCFLSLLMLLALNDTPGDVLRAERVYNAVVEIDSDCVRDLCRAYNAKLRATLRKIDYVADRLSREERLPVDNDTVEACFESDVTVPVKLEHEVKRQQLMAQYKKIGLAKDCPIGVGEYWDEQYHSINTTFVRYIKEPRRAVRTAARETFHGMKRIDDERAGRLNEYQREDIQNHLQKEEAAMISTVTTHLYNTERYRKMMGEADRVIRRGIGQRMSRRKTISMGVLAVLAYFLGFVPLFWSNLNDTESFLFSFVFAAAAIGTFALLGFLCLFDLRRKLVNRFKHFNYVMSGIISEIDGSMQGFSDYLSHACNVMRDYSVLNYSSESFSTRHGILDIHKTVIISKIQEVNELFSEYLEDGTDFDEAGVQPYDFDFTKMADYSYELPYPEVEKRIEFMQEGNEIFVGVDYLKAVTIEREELYD